MENDPLHIDAVITWVDGNDRQHYKKMQMVLGDNQETRENALLTGKDKTRFLDNGELKFCIESIRKFAPFIRTIHLVTDNQKPKFLTEKYQKEYGIQLVNHQDIFRDFEEILPTFNSRTIETALWRIPGLANHFVYFNDDFVLTSPVVPEDFFPDGNVTIRGAWNSVKYYGAIRIKLNQLASYISKKLFGITRSMHLLQQIKSAQLAGFEKKYYRTPHVPHPVIKSTLSEFFEENMDAFESNIQYKFRNMQQFSAIFLAYHLEILRENVVLKQPDDFLMLNGELDISLTLRSKLSKIERGDVKFICIQGYEKYSMANQHKISKLLETILNSN